MIIFHRDSALIGSKTLNIDIYLELEDDNKDEYISGVGSVVKTDKIANRALQQSCCLENKLLYGIFGESLKEDIDVCSDDVYDYPTLEHMLKNRTPELLAEWNKQYRMLEEQQEIVDYNNKSYKVYIQIYTERDE